MLTNMSRKTFFGSTQKHAAEGQTGDIFKHIRVFHSIRCRFPPGEGCVTGYKHTRNRHRVEVVPAEAANDHRAGIANVPFLYFVCAERFGDRDGAVKVIGVRRPETGNRSAGLGPGSCKLRVGVDDTPNLGKFAIKQCVGVEVA